MDHRDLDASATHRSLAASASASVIFDTTSPSVTVSTSTATTKTGGASFSIVFNEDVVGFVEANVNATGVSGCTGTPLFSGSGSTYTYSVTGCPDGTLFVTVDAGVTTDAAGNPNLAASASASVIFDTTPPSVTVSTSTSTAQTVGASCTIGCTEYQDGVEEGNVNANGDSGCTGTPLYNGSGSTDTYSLTVDPH